MTINSKKKKKTANMSTLKPIVGHRCTTLSCQSSAKQVVIFWLKVSGEEASALPSFFLRV